MHKLTLITGRAVPVPGDDIDTDRIIPARYLRCITFDGLGAALFIDARKADPSIVHPLDDPRFAGANILISGRNFGCGSSREHAPQAILRAGFQAVIAESFAGIFFGNALGIGLPCVTINREDLGVIIACIQKDPASVVEVDLVDRVVKVGDFSVPAGLPESTRSALINGQWDMISELLSNNAAAKAVHDHLPYLAWNKA